ncbi:MAG: hypothetical protein JSS61_02595 [Verrucomicrobia bacterium]|nr:hypothetical protein [Verrucomicrobiota bacterium]
MSHVQGSIPFFDRISDQKVWMDCTIQNSGKTDSAFKRLVKEFEMRISGFGVDLRAKMADKVITVPFSYLFYLEDIPEEFRIQDLSDWRLYDAEFLEKVAEWIRSKVREEHGLSLVCKEIEPKSVSEMLAVLRDPVMGKKAREFALFHELVHLKQSEETEWKSSYSFQDIKRSAKIERIAAGIIGALSLTLFPFVPVYIAITGLGLSICLGLYSHFMLRGQKVFFVAREKDADLRAAELLNDATGGIYFFDTVRQTNLMWRALDPHEEKRLDGLGNHLFHQVHPPITERIRYLSNFKPQLAAG